MFAELPRVVAHASRSRDPSYIGLFSILGAVWLSFNVIRGFWTSITQVMVRFPGLPYAALFWPNLLSRFLGLIFDGEKLRIWASIPQGNCNFI